MSDRLSVHPFPRKNPSHLRISAPGANGLPFDLKLCSVPLRIFLFALVLVVDAMVVEISNTFVFSVEKTQIVGRRNLSCISFCLNLS